MSNFFARMGERALGVGNSLVPAVTPLYGNAPSARAEPAFIEETTQQIVNAPATPRVAEQRRSAANVPPEPARQPIERESGSREVHTSEHGSRSVSDETPGHSGPQAAPTLAAKPGKPVAAAKLVTPLVNEGNAGLQRPPPPIEARSRTPLREDEERPTVAPAADEARREETAAEVARPRNEESSPGTDLEAMLARLKVVSRPGEASAAAPAPTVVRISIGRVEVRAAPTPGGGVTRPSRERKEPQGPSLAQFLAKRPLVSP
jgi:hypothetical protein